MHESSLIDLSGTRVLVVDDDPASIRIVEAFLKKNGYDTLTASGARQCLIISKKEVPDLILLDISMPDMSGLEVCKRLKQESRTCDIPIIFVTASTDNETLKEAFESGGSDYVRKPVNSTELLVRIKSVLTQRKLTEELLQREKLTGVLEMAGAVCHELNQPIQAVSGIAEVLLMDMEKDNPRYGDLKKILDQALRMGEITRKLMLITKYETKNYVGKAKIIDIERASAALN